jgi:hypothetical protein
MPDHESQATPEEGSEGMSGELAPAFPSGRWVLTSRPFDLFASPDGEGDGPKPPTESEPSAPGQEPEGASGELESPFDDSPGGTLADVLGYRPTAREKRTDGVADVPEQQNEIRLQADRERYADLRAAEFRGAVMEDFAGDLWQYGLRVIKGWLRDGSIPGHALRYGIKISPSWVELEMWERSATVRDELAFTTVAEAVSWYTKTVLPSGMWDPDKGASLRTYFIGACMHHFRTAYRSWSRQRRRTVEHFDALGVLTDRPAAGTDPALVIEQRDTIAAILAKATPEARAICALIYATDATYASIGEQLGGMSVRAVEGQMRRLRLQAKQAGGRPDAARTATRQAGLPTATEVR